MEENGRGTIAEADELARRPDVDVVPTAPEEPNILHSRRSRALRRLFMTLLLVVLGLGLSGVLGVRTRTVTVEDGGWQLTVKYGQVTRAGLATPWTLEIRHAGGFDGPVSVSTTTDYLDMFDENGFDPQPSQSTADAERVFWQFEPPEGDTLGVSFDARLEPGVHWGRDGETSVLVDGEPVVTARYRTWVVP